MLLLVRPLHRKGNRKQKKKKKKRISEEVWKQSMCEEPLQGGAVPILKMVPSFRVGGEVASSERLGLSRLHGVSLSRGTEGGRDHGTTPRPHLSAQNGLHTYAGLGGWHDANTLHGPDKHPVFPCSGLPPRPTPQTA